MVRAIAWTGASKWATQLLTWASTIVVARILLPADYGIFGMATVYLGLVALISEFGLGQAIVVLREMSSDHIAQINTLSVAFGGILFAASCALAIPIGHFFHTTKLAPVIAVMSLSFLISGMQIVPDALLQRGLRFKLLACFDTVRTFAQAPVTILLAWLGFGYWSLALSSVSGVVVYSALVIIASPCAFARPRWGEIRGALKFSGDVLGSRVAWYTYSNSDFMVAGRMLGQSALGAYEMAWTIASAPVDKITSLVTRVTRHSSLPSSMTSPSCDAICCGSLKACRSSLFRPALESLSWPINLCFACSGLSGLPLLRPYAFWDCMPDFAPSLLYFPEFSMPLASHDLSCGTPWLPPWYFRVRFISPAAGERPVSPSPGSCFIH